MSTDQPHSPLANPVPMSRRQILGAAGMVAGSFGFLQQPLLTANDSPKTKTDSDSGTPGAGMKCSVRITAISYQPPYHDHHQQGVNLDGVREMVAKVARERPDFVCFPEACACSAQGFAKGIESAPEVEPYLAAVGKIAKEFNTNLVVPFLERQGNHVYNSVPIVDRQGKLVLVYRKNYPTTLELEEGITPGTEIPVAECDGLRVGAAICFDANFDPLAARLADQRARLVFWPSMYWGGKLLQHWALRYGFGIAVAYGAESAIIDMNGDYLIKRGAGTSQVQSGFLQPWATADLRVNRELYHLDYNQLKISAINAKYSPDVEFDIHSPEGYFLMTSHRPDLPVESIAQEFELETLREYLARSTDLRNKRLAT